MGRDQNSTAKKWWQTAVGVAPHGCVFQKIFLPIDQQTASFQQKTIRSEKSSKPFRVWTCHGIAVECKFQHSALWNIFWQTAVHKCSAGTFVLLHPNWYSWNPHTGIWYAMPYSSSTVQPWCWQWLAISYAISVDICSCRWFLYPEKHTYTTKASVWKVMHEKQRKKPSDLGLHPLQTIAGDACEFLEICASNDSRNPTICWLNKWKSAVWLL